MRLALIFCLAWPWDLGAQPAITLSLKSYLEQVKTQGPEARSAVEGVVSAEKRLIEYESTTTPELYASYNLVNDEKETAQPDFQGTKTKALNWQVGIKKNTTFGLSGNLNFQHQQVNVAGVNTNFFRTPDYTEAKASLELRQALWRNGFGESTRSEVASAKAGLKAEYLKRRMELKNVLLRAENTYWSLVSLNQIIKLQQENVDRARAYRNRLSGKARLRLYDDVDAMQAEAAYQERELELQKSMDDREILAREFNTLRGRASSAVEGLEALPEKDILLRTAKSSLKAQTREDLRMAVEVARSTAHKARSQRTSIKPKLDLVGSYTSNGRDIPARPAYEEVEKFDHPGWAVGVEFSIALDFGLLSDLRQGYKALERSAKEQEQFAEFNEERVWNDMIQKKQDAQGRFERYLNLEKLQTQLAKRERQRLNNGRTTTFQALQSEQNLALTQIRRVESQRALIEIHNVVKTFAEEIP